MILVDAVHRQHEILTAVDAFVQVETTDRDVELPQVDWRAEPGRTGSGGDRLLGMYNSAEAKGEGEGGKSGFHHPEFRLASLHWFVLCLNNRPSGPT